MIYQVVGSKRAREKEEPPRLSLATALPLSVWQEHLAPRLSRVEAVRLSTVCQALRGVMSECPVDVGEVRSYSLEDALTCFPAAQSMDLVILRKLQSGRRSKVVHLLRRHGETLKHVRPRGEGAEQAIDSAVRLGALPKLTYFKMIASCTQHGQWLSDGRLRHLEEVCVALRDAEAFHASMEHLRQLSHLRDLTIQGLRAPMPAAVFPAFIPPSLKTLTLDHVQGPALESLLQQMPPMLQASGAGLVELQVISAVTISEESGAELARVLQTCSPTLKTLRIISSDVSGGIVDRDSAFEVALGLESCAGLERLEVPGEIFCSLPPTCPAFTRLTHLTFKGDNAPIDLTSPVWGLVASGLLPALTDLHVKASKGLSWGAEGQCGLARALEGVAGTLTRLTLEDLALSNVPPSAACRALGFAMGKMRRLSYLSLRLSQDGQSYHAMGRGGAASGGCPPLSVLRMKDVRQNLGCLAYEPSLIVPSVRNLHVSAGGGGREGEDVLVLYCGLVQMGYKRRFTTDLHAPPLSSHLGYRGIGDNARLDFCLAAILRGGGIKARARARAGL
jgi:hypothetical protein